MPEPADFTQPFDANDDEAGVPLMNLSTIIVRIEEAVESETSSIRTDARFDIKASNVRKSRYLYELNKAISSLRGAVLGDEQRAGISRLRDKLAINEAVIRAHLSAVSEVAALMQDAIQRADADGTYSADEFGREASPA